MLHSYLGIHPDWCVDVNPDQPGLMVRYENLSNGDRANFQMAVPLPGDDWLERLRAMSDRGLAALMQLQSWAGTLDDIEVVKAAYAQNQVGIWWATIVNPESLPRDRRFEVGYPHHCTLLYGVPFGEGAHLAGQEITLRATLRCWNDRIEAYRVELPPGIPCNKVNPHITISRIKDVPPSYSNEMLVDDHHDEPVDLAIVARIEFRPHMLQLGGRYETARIVIH